MPPELALSTEPRRRVRARALISTLLLGLFLAAELCAQNGPVAAVESVDLLATDGGQELRVASSGTLRLVGVQMDPGGSLVIQLPRHLPAPGVVDLSPQTGLVSAVRLVTEQTSRGPLTRVVVDTRQQVAHSVSSEGSLLRLRVWPRGTETPEGPLIARLHSQVAQLEASLDESEQVRTALARRSESLEQRNQTLAERFKTLESRRGVLDSAMKATLGEATELLRDLGSRNRELNGRLRQAEDRERELAGRLEALDGSLAESESARRELAARLEAVLEESSELERQLSAQQSREAELESALAASREQIERLAQRDSAVARELGERLEQAEAREDELRSQLAVLQETLAESRDLEQPGPEAGAATLTRVRTGDGYEGWVHGDDPGTETGAAEGEARSSDDPAPELEARREQAPPAARSEAREEARIVAAEPESQAEPESPAEVVPVAGSPAGTTTGTLYLRSGPGKTHVALRVLPRGSAVRVESRAGRWLRVRTDQDEGWISGRFVKLADGASPELGRSLAAALEGEASWH